MKTLLMLIALSVMASAGESHPTYTPALPNETAWQWLARNHQTGPPLRHSVEMEPDKTLVTACPYVMPPWNDPEFNAFAEQDIIDGRSDGKTVLRVYRRGVFCGYQLVWPMERSPRKANDAAVALVAGCDEWLTLMTDGEPANVITITAQA